MKLGAYIEEWEMSQPFRITGSVWTHSRCVVVELADGGLLGRGEAQGVYYLGETAESLYAQVKAVAATIERGITRAELQGLLPPGGARNALDCALWDLEAKLSGRSAAELAGLAPLRAVEHRLRTTGRATLTEQQLAGWQALQAMVVEQATEMPDE